MNAHMTQTLVETLSYKGMLYERYPSNELYTWHEAIEYLNQLKEKSMKNWRLATVEELEKFSTMPNKKFLQKLETSWSQTEENNLTAWVMSFKENLYYPRDKECKFRVLCVQDTPLKRSIKFF